MKKVAVAILVLAIVVGATYGGIAFAGKPVKDSGITPITLQNLDTTPYTVPSGQNLFITNLFTNGVSQWLKVDVTVIAKGLFNYELQNYPFASLQQPIVVGEGQTVSANEGNVAINGYLQNN